MARNFWRQDTSPTTLVSEVLAGDQSAYGRAAWQPRVDGRRAATSRGNLSRGSCANRHDAGVDGRWPVPGRAS